MPTRPVSRPPACRSSAASSGSTSRPPADAAGLFAVYSDPRCYEQGFAMMTPPPDGGGDRGTRRGRSGGPRRRRDGPDGIHDPARRRRRPRPGGHHRRLELARRRRHRTRARAPRLDDVRLALVGHAGQPGGKLLLLEHAFETCGFGRVKIQTDVINARSRAAILKLGAVFEGVTRRDVRRPDGTWRDSAVHSILVDEWPTASGRAPAGRPGLAARALGWAP